MGPLLMAAFLFFNTPVRAEISTVEQAHPSLASGILMKAKMVRLGEGMLVLSDSIQVEESKIRGIVEQSDPKLRDELRKNQFFLLERETMKALLMKEASSSVDIKGLSEVETIQAYLGRKFRDVKVSLLETQAFYDENKTIMGGLPFDQMKEAIQQVLAQQKKEDAVASYLRELGGKTDIRVNREWVEAQAPLAKDNPVDKARTSGKPSMIEFGADGCPPCEMMQPILENLKKSYKDKLNVVFVHVGENPILGSRFGIQSIPVQAFYDKSGKEFFRHVGFFAEEEVVKKLKEMGVQ
jgi:thiol-disulfide isomerase/thioredoxin